MLTPATRAASHALRYIWRVVASGSHQPIEPVMTSALLATEYWTASTSAEGLPDPAELRILHAMICAPGATPVLVPAVPSPTTVPATCVPWLWSSSGSRVCE